MCTMAFTQEEREAFLAMLPDLGPLGSSANVAHFVEERRAASLSEASTTPGFDQVRAGLFRVLGQLLDAEEKSAIVSNCRAAIDSYIEAVSETDLDPLFLMARHPSWVAIASMELDRWNDTPPPSSVDRAVQLATAGFEAVGDGQATGRGEVLWAIAEQADEAGWTQVATRLYEATLDAPFVSDEGPSQVRLLLALRYVEDRDARAQEFLAHVADDALASHRSRIHAAWVLAAMRNETGDTDQALLLLKLARDLAQDAEDEAVLQRVDEAISQLKSPVPEP
jgi:hypothetical protein